MRDSQPQEMGSGNVPFPTTLWSSVLSAGAGSRGALETLAERYWRPVYSYLRRSGRQPNDAADLTQAFFISILEGRMLQVADRNRGRFRTFLLTCLKNLLANEHDREQALKRGGGRKVLSLDVENAERVLGAGTVADPDREFERQWAADVLGRALGRLKGELQPKAAEVFSLVHDGKGASYGEIAKRMEMTEDSVAASIHRSREKLREILEEEIRATVESPDQVKEELGELLRVVSSSGTAPTPV